MSKGKRIKRRRFPGAVKVAFAVLSLVGLIVIAASCGGYGTSSSPPSSATTSGNTASVSMKNISFNPSDLTVNQGTTVTWTNDDNTTHTVTSDSGLFDSGNVSVGNTFSYTFNQTGTFAYHCTIHGPNMKGTITVVSGGAGAAPTTGASPTTGGGSPSGGSRGY